MGIVFWVSGFAQARLTGLGHLMTHYDVAKLSGCVISKIAPSIF